MQPEPTVLSRRSFLKAGAGTAAALVLGFRLPAASSAEPEDAVLTPSGYLRIDADGIVTVTLDKTELGQGIHTALAMLIAEELEADWSTVRLADEMPTDPSSWDGRMGTGASRSITGSYTPMRQVGATAREMLIRAAARQWDVAPEQCRARLSRVAHEPSGRSLPFGELVAAASRFDPPADPVLKNPRDFTIVGTPVTRLDLPELTTGEARFGLDVKIPGMLYACMERPPSIGATVTDYDASKALAVGGVRHVVEVPPGTSASRRGGGTNPGVAVVADSTWKAIKGRQALEVRWSEPNAGVDQADLESAYRDAIGAIAIPADVSEALGQGGRARDGRL